MDRSIILSFVLAVLSLAGGVSRASADIDATYTFYGTLPGLTFTGGGSCNPFSYPLCPSGDGPPLGLSLPQFNPALGSLQFVLLAVDAYMNVDATLTNYPITNCQPGICHNDAAADFNFGAVGSVSTGGSICQLNFGFNYPPTGLVSIGDGGGTGVTGASYDSSYYDEYDNDQFCLSPASFVGTGQVNFDLSSELNISYIFADSWSVTAEPSQLGVLLIYDYIPTPEPSLFVLTAGMFGLLAIWRVRRESTKPN